MRSRTSPERVRFKSSVCSIDAVDRRNYKS
jgi:hypothetical protein